MSSLVSRKPNLHDKVGVPRLSGLRGSNTKLLNVGILKAGDKATFLLIEVRHTQRKFGTYARELTVHD